MSNNHQNAPEKYIFCTNQLKTTTEKFVWTIDNFSFRQKKHGEFFQSEDFKSTTPNAKKWRLKMYPNGDKEEFKDYISLYIILINSSNDEEADAKFQFSIRKSDGQEYVLSSMLKECSKFNRLHPSWGFNKLIKRDRLFNDQNGYLEGDRCTIVCKLIVLQESVEKAHVEVPECRGMEDLSNLYEQSIFTDCKIISEDNKEFKVHKCILSCRSPVFGAMFEHEMLERNSNRD